MWIGMDAEEWKFQNCQRTTNKSITATSTVSQLDKLIQITEIVLCKKIVEKWKIAETQKNTAKKRMNIEAMREKQKKDQQQVHCPVYRCLGKRQPG